MSFVKNRAAVKDCGKVKFASEAAALHGGLGWRGGAGMTAYYHGPCRSWHVGHPPKKGRR